MTRACETWSRGPPPSEAVPIPNTKKKNRKPASLKSKSALNGIASKPTFTGNGPTDTNARRSAASKRPRARRLRITQPLVDSIDGIQLSPFVTGAVYDVGTSLANYLLA